MILRGSDNKVLRNTAGEVLQDSAGSSSKIFHIDTEFLPNRIFKDGSNLVSQVTDKVNNLPLVNNTTLPDFDYDKGFGFDGVQIFRNDDFNTTIKRCIIHVKVQFDSLMVADNKFLSFLDRSFSSSNRVVFGLATITGVKTLYFYYNTVSGPQTSYAWTPTIGQEYDVTAVYENTTLEYALYIDGVKVAFTTAIGDRENTAGYLAIGAIPGFAGEGKMYMKSLSLYNYENLDIATAEGVINSLVGKETFTYYKRYNNTNIVSYLNSRYLKDAVINSNDEIEKLENEIALSGFDSGDSTNYPIDLYQVTQTKRPTITKKGIYFDGTNVIDALLKKTIYQSFTTDYPSGFDSCLLAMWHSPESTGSLQIFARLRNVTNSTDLFAISFNHTTNSGQKYTVYDGTTFHGDSTVYPIGTYNHIAVMQFGTDVYLFINGVLKIKTAIGWDRSGIATRVLLRYGAYDDISLPATCYMDEFLFSVDDTLINPTGATVGEKLFDANELFERRSLSDNFNLPLIELKSTNVNKDGSNNVQTWYNTYKPALNSARQTVLVNQPVENGNGIEWTDSDGLLISPVKFDVLNIFFGAWFYHNDNSGTSTLVNKWLSTGNKRYFVMNRTNTTIAISTSQNGQAGNNGIDGFSLYTKGFGEWYYGGFVMQTVGVNTYIVGHVNGIVVSKGTYSNLTTITDQPDLAIGNYENAAVFGVDGNLDDLMFKYHDYDLVNAQINDVLFDPPKRSSE